MANTRAAAVSPHSLLPESFRRWFFSRGWHAHAHQLAMLEAAREERSALLIAPTGGGKTLAGFLPTLVDLATHPTQGLHTLYISPLKALAGDIERNLRVPIQDMGLDIRIELRNGDTPSSRRKRQLAKPPHILLTTPESLELILSYGDGAAMLGRLKRVIIDEVHALAPGKRGHLTALCLARLKRLNPRLHIIGLSATVADPEGLARWLEPGAGIIRASESVKPELHLLTAKKVPWSGYMAGYAVADIYRAICAAKTSIVFVNTRAQAELLFQKLWEINSEELPIALHHGSLAKEHRLKVEAMMGQNALRAIVATASLDLGLDWGAVDLVIQVGAPKGISRLLQRIGRSNHRLDEPSEAVLVPCNRFEMIECIAVTEAIADGEVDGDPLLPGTLDVLAQFIMNCACAGGFEEDALYTEVTNAAPYRSLSRERFDACVRFVADGGYALRAYERFQRIEKNEKGLWEASIAAARRHRMNTGTIVEYETLRVSLRRPKSRVAKDLGRIEEYLVQGMRPGDTFLFAGQLLRYRGVHEMTVETEPAAGERPKIPSFNGGKLPLSSSLAERVRRMLENPEHWQGLPSIIVEWLTLQQQCSLLPGADYMLAETFPHEKLEYLIVYSFAGRAANQTLGLLVTQQMESDGLLPLGFVANEYAMAIWGLKRVPDAAALIEASLKQENSEHWIESSQMARRAFREVAIISGLVERQTPGKKKTGRQVTMSTDLIYDVLRKYDPDHILLESTRGDVAGKLADMERLRDLAAKLPVKHIALERVSPLAVPLMVDAGSERVRGGEGEAALLDAASRERAGDALLAEAVS